MISGSKKRWFTLVELLIVIVIIWVLAASIIPRLTSVRERAKDIARRSDLNQLTTAIIAYQMDNAWLLPGTWMNSISTSDLLVELKNSWLSSIPTDPTRTSTVDWLWTKTSTPWQYLFMHIKRNDIPWASFVLMARTETHGASNWLYSGGMANAFSWWLILTGNSLTELIPCNRVTEATGGQVFLLIPGWDCIFTNYNQLRFIIAR